MSCEKYDILISAYMDNEVTEQEKIEVEQHLKQCESCRSKLEAMQHFKHAISVEHSGIKPLKKSKNKFYNKLYTHFLILFIGLVICFSLVAFSGGVIQLYLIKDIPLLLKALYFIGIGMILVGIFILLNDIMINLFRIIKKK